MLQYCNIELKVQYNGQMCFEEAKGVAKLAITSSTEIYLCKCFNQPTLSQDLSHLCSLDDKFALTDHLQPLVRLGADNSMCGSGLCPVPVKVTENNGRLRLFWMCLQCDQICHFGSMVHILIQQETNKRKNNLYFIQELLLYPISSCLFILILKHIMHTIRD